MSGEEVTINPNGPSPEKVAEPKEVVNAACEGLTTAMHMWRCEVIAAWADYEKYTAHWAKPLMKGSTVQKIEWAVDNAKRVVESAKTFLGSFAVNRKCEDFEKELEIELVCQSQCPFIMTDAIALEKLCDFVTQQMETNWFYNNYDLKERK